jgi:single-strand DNA-binding protein|nr:MAG TPA: Single strand binding protein [Caudoviricetes sp.]
MSNELTIVGNVGETIELHNLPGGGTVCNFSVADNRVRKLDNGTYETINTTWRRVAAYKNAETIAENLTKGARVIIRGIEEMRTYTRTDGTEGNQLRFIASVVGIVPTNPKPIGSTGRPAPRPAVPTQYPPHGYQAQPTNGYQQHPAPQAPAAQTPAPRSPQGYQQAPAYPTPYTTDQPPF